MSLHRYDAKRDANEPEIVKALEDKGLSVYRLNQPLDLLVGYNKRNYLVEVKVEGKKLNKNQIKFVDGWKGQYFVCFSASQAERFADEVIKSNSSVL